MAIVTLALGVGATTAVFSFVDALLLREPPGVAAGGGALVNVYTGDFSSGPYGSTSYPDFESIRDRHVRLHGAGRRRRLDGGAHPHRRRHRAHPCLARLRQLLQRDWHPASPRAPDRRGRRVAGAAGGRRRQRGALAAQLRRRSRHHRDHRHARWPSDRDRRGRAGAVSGTRPRPGHRHLDPARHSLRDACRARQSRPVDRRTSPAGRVAERSAGSAHHARFAPRARVPGHQSGHARTAARSAFDARAACRPDPPVHSAVRC